MTMPLPKKAKGPRCIEGYALLEMLWTSNRLCFPGRGILEFALRVQGVSRLLPDSSPEIPSRTEGGSQE